MIPASDLVVVALTPRGLDLGQRLCGALGRGSVLLAEGAVRKVIEAQFRDGRPLVCVMALGIVVRIVGPLARGKRRDPPVVVVDEAGRFAVSVLGGHAAGANALTEEVAAALGAAAVITTASEALGLPPLDLVGRRWGWKIEEGSRLTEVAAATVRGESIAVYQDAGRRDWWQEFGTWPDHFQHVTVWPNGRVAGLLAISDRLLPELALPAVIYRPPTLVAGVGCRRGVPVDEIEELFQDVCRREQLAALSLGLVGTAALKAEEPGLRAFSALHGVPLRCYSAGELAAVGPLPTPSETVRAKVGVAGVAEPAAMLAAGTRELLVPKQRTGRLTLALARRREA
jgi:cobalt-precorrin 5A hydrolase